MKALMNKIQQNFIMTITVACNWNEILINLICIQLIIPEIVWNPR